VQPHAPVCAVARAVSAVRPVTFWVMVTPVVRTSVQLADVPEMTPVVAVYGVPSGATCHCSLTSSLPRGMRANTESCTPVAESERPSGAMGAEPSVRICRGRIWRPSVPLP
jgi:hypothetical protein